MATLAELNTLVDSSELNEKIRGAVMKAAVSVAYEASDTANHANRVKWAKQALSDPIGIAAKVSRYVVGALASETLATITSSSDTTIQDNVNASINIFADGS